MADSLFTYADADGDELRITRDYAVIHVATVDRDGEVTTVRVPHHVVPTLAKEILAAAGETGHRVVSQGELQGFVIHRAEQAGARSMRERAEHAAYASVTNGCEKAAVVDAIRALPLLPDGEVAHSGCSQPDSEQPAAVHVATPEGITPCGRGHHDVSADARISKATCLGCLRTLAQAPQDDLTETADTWPARPADLPHLIRQMDEWVRKVAAVTDPRRSPLADRVAQLERDMGRRERHARSLDDAEDRITGRVGAAEFRLDALELAAREAAQSGGAEHVQVAGGGSPRPCPVTAYNPMVFIDMVCAYDLGHTGPHYNPASGGWEWDNGGNVTQLDGRNAT